MTWTFRRLLSVSLVVAGVAMMSMSLSSTASAATGSSETSEYVEDARKYLEAGKIQAAITQLKNALRDDPNDVEARFMLGTIYLATRQGEAAEKELRTAYNQGLENDKLLELLGEALLMQGKNQAVLDEIQPGGLDPDQRAVVMTLRGRAHMALNQLDLALEDFRTASELSPDSVSAMSGIARILIQQKKVDEAMEFVDKALEVDPEFPGAILLKGEMLRMSADFDGSIEQFAKILEKNPNHMEALLARAAALIDLNRELEAQRDIDKVMELAPQHPLALHLSALILAKKQDFAAADAMLDRAGVALDEYLPSQFLRGTIAYSRNNLEQAYFHLSGFLDQVPGHAPARRLLGSTLLRQSRFDEAVRTFEPLAASPQADATVYALMGSALMGTRDFDRSIEMFEKAIAADPDESVYHTQLALVRLTAGQGSEAVSDLENAVQMNPDARQATVLLAQVHLANNEFEEAHSIAEQLIAGKADDPVGYHLKGLALSGKGDEADAQAAFEQALGVDPGYFPAVQNLAQLEIAAGDVPAAERRYRAVLADDRRNEGAMIALSQLALSAGQRQEAIDWLEQASSLNPESPAAGLRLIDLYVQNGDPIQALATASALEQRLPDDVNVLEALARTQLLAGDAVSATATYTRLATLVPDNAQVFFALGKTQVMAGDTFAARTSYRRALEIDPTLIPAILDLINLEVDSARLQSAMEIAAGLRQAQPEMPMGDLLIGHVHTKMGDETKAYEAFQLAEQKINSSDSALRLYYGYTGIDRREDGFRGLEGWLQRRPDDEQMRRILATAYLEAGEYPSAIAHYDKLRETDGDNPVILNNLAWLYQQVDDERAVVLAARAYELLPDAAAVKDTYGWVLIERGDLDRGAALLEEANALAPDEPEIQYHLALARAKQGRAAEACALLQTVLSNEVPFRARDAAETLMAQQSCR